MDDDERPRTDWEARVAKAKREGTWYGPDEEPSPYPPAERRKRFWSGFGFTYAAAVLVASVLHVVLGRPGSPFEPAVLLDSIGYALVPACIAGWSATRPPKRR